MSVAVLVGLGAVLAALGAGLVWRRRTTDESGAGGAPDAPADPPADEGEEDLLPRPPLTHAVADGPAQARITIVASRVLQARCGHAPARSIARQLHDALLAHDVPHRITVPAASGAAEPPAEGTVGSGTPAWWRDRGASILDAPGDANLLLVDQVGGGGAYGRWAVVGAGGIDTDLPAADARAGPAADSLTAALHEVGHAFGVGHDLDADRAGDQHTGHGWNGRDGWHRTPMCVANGITNACGTPVPERAHDDVVQELHYTGCTIENWAPLRHR